MKKSELIAFRTTPENHKYLQNLAKEDAEVQAIANVAWTQAIKDSWAAFKAAQ